MRLSKMPGIDVPERHTQEGGGLYVNGGPLRGPVRDPAEAEVAAGEVLMTPPQHMDGCRCPECDPDYNDPRTIEEEERESL